MDFQIVKDVNDEYPVRLYKVFIEGEDYGRYATLQEAMQVVDVERMKRVLGYVKFIDACVQGVIREDFICHIDKELCVFEPYAPQLIHIDTDTSSPAVKKHCMHIRFYMYRGMVYVEINNDPNALRYFRIPLKLYLDYVCTPR